MGAPDLSKGEHRAMIITERVGAVMSICGIAFIIFTYLFAKGFCKPINRLIFYTSWGNLGVCLVALISEDGPDAGGRSALCQIQAFLVQLFLGVDTWWALCMAINIYLVLFKNWSTRQLRSLDHKYLIATYGISLIPAIVYIFIDTKSRGKIYGPAVLWCWISGPWAFLRIGVLYGFMWIAVIIALVIYIMAGIQVYQKREALSGYLNPFNESPFTAVMTTTEVTITSEDAEQHRQQHTKSEPELQVQDLGHHEEGYNPYSVNIEIGRSQEQPQRPRRPSRPAVFRLPAMTRRMALSEDNAEAFLYARVAFLFFVALLITWVPSSINRASALAHPDDLNFRLNFSSALVFAIQGFLNCLVYMMTSQTAVRNLWRKMWGRGPVQNLKFDNVERTARKGGGGKREGRQRLDSDTTSTTNLTVH